MQKIHHIYITHINMQEYATIVNNMSEHFKMNWCGPCVHERTTASSALDRGPGSCMSTPQALHDFVKSLRPSKFIPPNFVPMKSMTMKDHKLLRFFNLIGPGLIMYSSWLNIANLPSVLNVFYRTRLKPLHMI